MSIPRKAVAKGEDERAQEQAGTPWGRSRMQRRVVSAQVTASRAGHAGPGERKKSH